MFSSVLHYHLVVGEWAPHTFVVGVCVIGIIAIIFSDVESILFTPVLYGTVPLEITYVSLMREHTK